MKRLVEGVDSAEGLHVGIAAARWNQAVTDRLLDASVRRLEELDAARITVLRVPGALELPVAAKALVDAGCSAVVAIGTIVKGDTDHYEIVLRQSTAGIARVSHESGVPVTNAILAVHDYQHAVERSGPGESNKGVEAADAAVLAATALQELRDG